MINISTLFDPKYVFLIYAPILFALNRRLGHRTIIAITVTEWINQVLKWILAGERPYWYVHERAIQLTEKAGGVEGGNFSLGAFQYVEPIANLKQFPVTCELGAGSPSGHAMVTATVWYVLIDAYHRGDLFPNNPDSYSDDEANYSSTLSELGGQLRSLVKQTSWSVYTLMLVLVSLSRVYLACHFPHQCISGAILGILVAWFVCERLPLTRLSRRSLCLLSGFMFVSVMSTYMILRSLGFDPLWSVAKGLRWCAKKEYIHMDTTPFFSMMRYIGFCLGSGLAFDLVSSRQVGNTSSSKRSLVYIRQFTTALISILFGRFLLALPVPKTNLNIFYVISFCLYTLLSYAIAEPIPRLTKRIFESDLFQSNLEDNTKPTAISSIARKGKQTKVC